MPELGPLPIDAGLEEKLSNVKHEEKYDSLVEQRALSLARDADRLRGVAYTALSVAHSFNKLKAVIEAEGYQVIHNIVHDTYHLRKL